MQFDIDITMRMRSGGESFLLHSQFTATNRALVLFGPSGSGKTLTLKAIAGLLQPDSGHIRVNGQTLYDSASGVDLPTRQRRVGYVFQNYALFPHLTVEENISFGLRSLFDSRIGTRLGSLFGSRFGSMPDTVSRQNERRVRELIRIFGLSSVAALRPASLSGGQQQRTALARALAPEPDLLLLDEPFSALDQPLRLRMRTELARTLEQFSVPMIMVTHDSDEMESFAEAVVVYRNGAVVGVHPATAIPGEKTLTQIIQREVALAYEL